jgi:hypothetical protein
MTDNDDQVLKFLRLHNGDDIVSEVVEIQEDDEHFYMLINPLKVVYMSGKTGYMSIAFIPWVFPSIVDKHEFTIHFDEILMTADVSKNVNEHYWESINAYIKSDSVEEIHPQEEEPKEETNSAIEEIIQALKQGRTYH